jgi:hypothetical protein
MLRKRYTASNKSEKPRFPALGLQFAPATHLYEVDALALLGKLFPSYASPLSDF